jgi:hypothetical protein
MKSCLPAIQTSSKQTVWDQGYHWLIGHYNEKEHWKGFPTHPEWSQSDKNQWRYNEIKLTQCHPKPIHPIHPISYQIQSYLAVRWWRGGEVEDAFQSWFGLTFIAPWPVSTMTGLESVESCDLWHKTGHHRFQFGSPISEETCDRLWFDYSKKGKKTEPSWTLNHYIDPY